MKPVKEVIHKCLRDLNPKSILDLGCGGGKFTINFAKRGISVTGVDKDKQEIHEDNFNFIQEDIRDFKFPKKYNLIFTSMILHFLKKEEAWSVIKKMKESTSIKGYNLLVCMSNKDDSEMQNPKNFYPSIEELHRIYLDWEIIESELGLSKEHQHYGGEIHSHKVIVFLARNKD